MRSVKIMGGHPVQPGFTRQAKAVLIKDAGIRERIQIRTERKVAENAHSSQTTFQTGLDEHIQIPIQNRLGIAGLDIGSKILDT